MGYYNNYYDSGVSTGCLSCLLMILLCIALGAFSGFIFMVLWNWLAPIFWSSAPTLTFLQSLGVCILLSWIGSFFRNKNK